MRKKKGYIQRNPRKVRNTLVTIGSTAGGVAGAVLAHRIIKKYKLHGSVIHPAMDWTLGGLGGFAGLSLAHKASNRIYRRKKKLSL